MRAYSGSPTFCAQTGSGAHPPSYPTGTVGLKKRVLEADHTPPPSAKVKNGVATPTATSTLPPYVLMA
jgi:hypothetical protein